MKPDQLLVGEGGKVKSIESESEQKIVTAHSRRSCDLDARSDAVVSINGAFMVNW